MRRRILAAILSITACAVLLFGVPLAVVVSRLVAEDATLRIERQAVLAASHVPADYTTSGDPVELPAGSDGTTLALYTTTGKLLAGRGPATADTSVQTALANQIVAVEQSGRRIVAVPITVNEAVIGVIRAEQPTSQSDVRTRQLIAVLAVVALAVVAGGAVIGYIVAGLLARPVRRLRDAAVQLGDGDFTAHIAPSHVPELDEAGQALTLTARRLNDLVDRERAFSADASHQLRTPLAGLRSGIETELAFPRPDHSLILTEALGDIARLEQTITELLTIARTPNLVTVTCSLSTVQTDLTHNWHDRFASAGRPLIISDAADTPPIRGNAAILRHAIDVLLDNSLVHGAGVTRIGHHTATDTITITVRDDGPGPATDTTPAASTDNRPTQLSPHGLGLPLARRLVNTLPGRLNIITDNKGSRTDIIVARADTPHDHDDSP